MKLSASFHVAAALVSASAFASTGDAANFAGGAWSPYWVGLGIGLLTCLTLYFSDEPVGASSFYAAVAGYLGLAIAPRHTMKLAYFKDKPPRVNWKFVFVLAIIAGSALAALSGGEFRIQGLPALWVNAYGESSRLKYSVLSLAGGILMAFGARLAGGCTSGHGISGTSQLSVSSWIAVCCFFLGGIIAIRFIY